MSKPPRNARIAALQMISGPRVADNLETAGRLIAEAVDQDPVEPGFHGPRLLVPFDVLGRRAGTDRVRRFAAGI